MKKNKYLIEIGREHIENISTKELKSLKAFVQDFFVKEDKIPMLNSSTVLSPFSCRLIVIYKNAFFDSATRKFQTDYNLFIGNDSIMEISGQELVALYFSLQNFLMHSEHYLKETTPPVKTERKKEKRKITIKPYVPQRVLIGLQEKSLSVNKRTWLTSQQMFLHHDYTLSTPHGSAFRIDQEEFHKLYEDISNFITDKK